jgi:hypothetical protein
LQIPHPDRLAPRPNTTISSHTILVRISVTPSGLVSHWLKPERPEISVRKVLVVPATTAVGMALISCSEPPAVYSPPTSRMLYEPSARIEWTPLPPPVGYESAAGNAPTPSVAYGGTPDEASKPKATTPGEWRSSPRWAAVKGQGCIVVEQDAHAKFAPAEAAKVKVGNCSKNDLDARHGNSASDSNANAPRPTPNSLESEMHSGSDQPSPSNPYSSPPTPPSENRSGTIEPWKGDI